MRNATVAVLGIASSWPRPARSQQVLVGLEEEPAGRGDPGRDLGRPGSRRRSASSPSFGTRHTLSDPDNPTRGIGAARRWIKAELESLRQGVGRAADRRGRLVRPAGRAAGAEADDPGQPGGDPARRPARPRATAWLVVSGHYDSIPRPMSDTEIDAPGANDDASGTAVSMELARVMSKYHFDATLVFLAVAGRGARACSARPTGPRRPKAEGRKIEAMLTDDIVGNTQGGNGVRDNRRVRVFSEGVPADRDRGPGPGPHGRSAARTTARRGNSPGTSRRPPSCYVPDFEVTLVFRRDRYGRGGDHIPFNERGYAAVRLTEPNENFDRQHQKVEVRDGVAFGDVVEKVDFAYVAQVARVNAATLASLALAPAPPSEARFGTGRPGIRHPDHLEARDRARPGRLPGRLAGHPPALLGARRSTSGDVGRGRRQGPLQGRPLLRRPGRRPGRQRQPARLPRPPADPPDHPRPRMTRGGPADATRPSSPRRRPAWASPSGRTAADIRRASRGNR